MFNFKFNKCAHRKLTPFSTGKFCPDCGKEVEIRWLVPRCECCNARRKAKVVFNALRPEDKFCIKCGSSEYYIEKKETLELFDVDYTVISKKEVNNGREYRETLQIWIGKENKTSETGNAVRFLPVFANKNCT